MSCISFFEILKAKNPLVLGNEFPHILNISLYTPFLVLDIKYIYYFGEFWSLMKRGKNWPSTYTLCHTEFCFSVQRRQLTYEIDITNTTRGVIVPFTELFLLEDCWKSIEDIKAKGRILRCDVEDCSLLQVHSFSRNTYLLKDVNLEVGYLG